MGFKNSTEIQAYLKNSDGKKFKKNIQGALKDVEFCQNYPDLEQCLNMLLLAFEEFEEVNDEGKRNNVSNCINDVFDKCNIEKSIEATNEFGFTPLAKYLSILKDALKSIQESILKP